MTIPPNDLLATSPDAAKEERLHWEKPEIKVLEIDKTAGGTIFNPPFENPTYRRS